MRIPLILLKHVARAYLNSLTGGLAGEFVFGIADDVMKAWQRDCDERARKMELEDLAQAATVEVKEAVAEVVSQVAPGRSDQDRCALTSYLLQVPASIRRTLRRPSDPSGRTVPQGLAVKTALDLAPLLPSRLPRFQPGDSPLAGVDRELVELLGVGGFGEVWKAINPNRPSMAPVALKFCLDDAARDRLLRHEARILDRVMRVGSHPGIVALRDTYLKAEPPCLEYEFVGGGELTGLIQDYRARGGMSPKGTARIVERLARTVGHFHRLDPPIVHRDLKPANILVTTDAEGRIGLKVADFGIGGIAARREIERGNTGVSRGEVNGSIARGSYTPLYASPEQVRGAEPDPRDDVHALGVLWFQALTGDLAHGAPTGLDWAGDLETRGLNREQIEVLASCFSSRQDRRPADAVVLAERIDAAFRLREKRADVTALKPVSETHRPEVPHPEPGRAATVSIGGAGIDTSPPEPTGRGLSGVTSEGLPPRDGPVDAGGQAEGCEGAGGGSGSTRASDDGRTALQVEGNSLGMRFALIPSGSFFMGSPEGRKFAFADEKPRHKVLISKPFFLSVQRVARSEYRSVTGRLPNGSPSRETGILDKVSWFEAVVFCNELSKKENLPRFYAIRGELPEPSVTVPDWGGEGYRLPTEAEWEYACRGGWTTQSSTGDEWIGPGEPRPEGASDEVDHAEGEESEGAVGPNEFGSRSMLGGAREWCWDRYAPTYYRGLPGVDPRGPSSVAFPLRAVRGESGVGRTFRLPKDGKGIGFRLARNLVGEEARRRGDATERPRFTARGALEPMGKHQWNVLVRNVEEMSEFWARYQIDTKMDWAGAGARPKATVSRKELVERCNAAGEGAEVEYDLEVQDRANGRGVAGVDLRVVTPSPPGEGRRTTVSPESTPSAHDGGVLETGISLDEAIARFVAEGGHVGKTARPEGGYYGTASKLRFVPCRCGWDDRAYACHDYIARNSRGTCYYVSHNLKTGLITCGPKGYHASRPHIPGCV